MAVKRPDRASCIVAWALMLAALLGGCSPGGRQMLDRADASWRKGRYYDAIRENEELYNFERRGRNAARALMNLGNIYYLNLRQLKQAIEYYNKLTTEFPDSPEALQARRQLAGIYAKEINDPGQAILEYDKILATRNLEDRNEILFQRADAYFKNEDYFRALRELRSLEDSGITGHLADQVSLQIGSIYLIQKKFADAVAPFQKVLTALCLDCRRRAILNLAETYENLFDFDNAIATLSRLDKSPENDQFIQREISRIGEKRTRIERGDTLGLPPTRQKSAARPAKGGSTPKRITTGKTGATKR